MARCIELAKMGAGRVSPNPMVGCVIVHNNIIIGEGFHEKYGQAHAEVNAIRSVINQVLLTESTLYVSLEPCAHFGLTPPCSDLIISSKIPHVVIGTVDSFAKVAGRGIEKMRNAGVEVEVGIMEIECRKLNKRFFTFHEKKRPYIILKWAETLDGFIDTNRPETEFGEPNWITGEKALLRVHQLRAAEDAILVGTNTAVKDNPSLTVRRCEGKNPVRVVIDKDLRLPENLQIFDGQAETIVINSVKSENSGAVEKIKIDYSKEIIPQILDVLFLKNIQSLIVEGGLKTLESFIHSGLWDEAHKYVGNKFFFHGIRAPRIPGHEIQAESIDNDRLFIINNRD